MLKHVETNSKRLSSSDGSHQLRSVAMISCCVIVLESRRHPGAPTRRWDALWFAQNLSHGLMEVSRMGVQKHEC